MISLRRNSYHNKLRSDWTRKPLSSLFSKLKYIWRYGSHVRIACKSELKEPVYLSEKCMTNLGSCHPMPPIGLDSGG